MGTEANCNTKCDALFALLAKNDEDLTDRVCHHECDCVIHKTNCNPNQQGGRPNQPAKRQQPPNNHNNQGNLVPLIHTEVVALLAADKNLTQANCDKKCDAIFALLAQKDETLTDRVCHHECDCVIHKRNCGVHFNHNNQGNLVPLIHTEVVALLAADKNLTQANC